MATTQDIVRIKQKAGQPLKVQDQTSGYCYAQHYASPPPWIAGTGPPLSVDSVGSRGYFSQPSGSCCNPVPMPMGSSKSAPSGSRAEAIKSGAMELPALGQASAAQSYAASASQPQALALGNSGKLSLAQLKERKHADRIQPAPKQPPAPSSNTSKRPHASSSIGNQGAAMQPLPTKKARLVAKPQSLDAGPSSEHRLNQRPHQEGMRRENVINQGLRMTAPVSTLAATTKPIGRPASAQQGEAPWLAARRTGPPRSKVVRMSGSVSSSGAKPLNRES